MHDLIELWLPPDRDFYLFPDQTSVDVKPTLRTTMLPPGALTYQYLSILRRSDLLKSGRLARRAALQARETLPDHPHAALRSPCCTGGAERMAVF
jgi:hypothetical protein